MLKVENVTKYYGDLKAVDNLSFEVEDGCIFGLLGLNGAGKTTTFRMIMGLIDDYTGSITLDGKKIDYSMTDKIGFLTEERSLLTKMTVVEQVKFYAILKNMKEEDIVKRLDYYLDKFGISEYKYKKINPSIINIHKRIIPIVINIFIAIFRWGKEIYFCLLI